MSIETGSPTDLSPVGGFCLGVSAACLFHKNCPNFSKITVYFFIKTHFFPKTLHLVKKIFCIARLPIAPQVEKKRGQLGVRSQKPMDTGTRFIVGSDEMLYKLRNVIERFFIV